MTDHSALIERLEVLVNPGDLVVGPNMMRAALEEAAAALRDLTEWRDIATAPKDGTWMLACWAGSDRPAFGVVKWDSCDWIEGGDVVGIPTHWLPLPSAPNQAKEAGE